ncbi:MAG: LptF/LptG family permease, partial [Rhodospirillaceae bacterium]
GSEVGAPITILAERGTMVKDQGISKMSLINGSRQEKKEETGKVSFLYFDSYTIEIGAKDEDDGAARFRKERERPFLDLFTIQPGDPVGEGLEWTFGDQQVMPMRMEGHLRLLKPINHFGFLLIGLAAILKGQFNRRGDSKRVIFAVMLVVLFQSASLGAANMAKRSYEALPLLDAMTLLPLLVGIIWMAWEPRGSGRALTPGPSPAAARS